MEPKLRLFGKEYPLVTPDLLTLGESADAERITGQGYDLFQGGALGLLALTYISVRRLDPSITLEDIRELTGGQIQVDMEEAEPVPLESSADTEENDTLSSKSSSSGSADDQEPTLEASGTPV